MNFITGRRLPFRQKSIAMSHAVSSLAFSRAFTSACLPRSRGYVSCIVCVCLNRAVHRTGTALDVRLVWIFSDPLSEFSPPGSPPAPALALT